MVSVDDLKGKRVLIAEDNGITVMQLQKAFARAGLIVIEPVNNGCDAVEAALRERPDIVLLDIGLPSLDGIEVARRIMAEAPTCVVMLTGHSDENVAQHVRSLGVAGYITKPVSSDYLIPALQNALQMFYECEP